MSKKIYREGIDPHYGDVSVEDNDIKIHLYKLPSEFQIGDMVRVIFSTTSILSPCKVVNVNFTDCKVRYDLSVPVEAEDIDGNISTAYTRIYNVDGAFVEKL